MAKRRKSPGPMHSKAQWRFLFATHKPFARKWAHETKGGKKVRYRRLPARKGVRKR
jgi:hypothetical protein